ncbi:MAG: type III secretion system inner rod subunit SctI [Deltaproteobacteria bacterium]|nr:type III secretion system inner rod subunit SctI [Deltaproteobacteria bacterium]
MIESVHSQKIAEQLEKSAEKETQKSVQPDEQDVSRFDQAMQDTSGLETKNPSEVQQQQLQETSIQAPKSAGDTILESLDKQRSSFEQKINQVGESLENMTHSENYSPAELLKLQWELHKATLQLEMTTKVVDKTDQNISTLLRNQG